MLWVRSTSRWWIKILLSTHGCNEAFNTVALHSREIFVRYELKSLASTHQNLAVTDNFLKFTANSRRHSEVLKTFKQNTTCEKFSFFILFFRLLPVHIYNREGTKTLLFVLLCSGTTCQLDLWGPTTGNDTSLLMTFIERPSYEFIVCFFFYQRVALHYNVKWKQNLYIFWNAPRGYVSTKCFIFLFIVVLCLLSAVQIKSSSWFFLHKNQVKYEHFNSNYSNWHSNIW